MLDQKVSTISTEKPLFSKTLKRLNKPKLSLGLGLTSKSKPLTIKKIPPKLELNVSNNSISTMSESKTIETNSYDTNTGTIDFQKLEIFNNNKKKAAPPPVPSKNNSNQQSLPGTPSTALTMLSAGADSLLDESNNDTSTILLEDLVQLGKLGSGNSGNVMKVLHIPTQVVYAKKVIPLPSTTIKDKNGTSGMNLFSENQNKQIKLQIKRELEIMEKIGKQDENSNIVTFKDAFYNTIEVEDLVPPLQNGLSTIKNNNEKNESQFEINEASKQNYIDDNKNEKSLEIEVSNKNYSTANEIIIIMEYMNLGSLDKILQTYKEHCKRCKVKVSPATSWFNRNVIISKIAHDVLNGLDFLYDNFKIIHRDIKPSNILLNSRGFVKICDFGVSKNTVNSVVDTFVGTSTYMSPERIQGGIYTTKGDVWSLGLSIIELLTGKFPLDSREIKYENTDEAENSLRPDGILDLLQRIVNEPSPHLPTNYPYDPKLVDFVNKCCIKNSDERASIKELLQHDFIQKYNFSKEPKSQERYTKDFKNYCKELKALIHDEKVIKRKKQLANIKK
ncbi:hypothetical protein QEN19_003103 [Hanseniaspora menglaensis]